MGFIFSLVLHPRHAEKSETCAERCVSDLLRYHASQIVDLFSRANDDPFDSGNLGERSNACHDGGEVLASVNGTGLCSCMSYHPDQPSAKLDVNVNKQPPVEKGDHLESHTGVAN